MIDHPLTGALAVLSQFLVADATFGDTLHRLAELTVDAVPPIAAAGMSMLDRNGRPTTAVFTDPAAPEIDEAQYRTGAGPCLDAWRQRRPISIGDTTDRGGRYDEFKGSCVDHGVFSTLSLPMIAGDKALGALNVYAREKCAFSDADVAATTNFAAVASAVLANATAYWGALELGQQLRQAMQSRAVIEQAKGMLMASSPELTADDAFAVLVRASQRENSKLRDVAQRIVDRRPPPSTSRG